MSEISEQLASKVMRLDEEVGRGLNRLQKAHEKIDDLKALLKSRQYVEAEDCFGVRQGYDNCSACYVKKGEECKSDCYITEALK